MHTILTATEINHLAQRLTQTPLGRSASVAKAAERFQRLLAAQVGPARAADAACAILSAPGFETAEGRLVAEIEVDAPEIPIEPGPAADPASVVIATPETAQKPATDPAIAPAPLAAPVPAPAPRPARKAREGVRTRARQLDLKAEASAGKLPTPPDFSAATHTRFRAKLDGLIALAACGDIEGLRAVTINPVSSSPKALARYRDLCIAALETRNHTKA